MVVTDADVLSVPWAKLSIWRRMCRIALVQEQKTIKYCIMCRAIMTFVHNAKMMNNCLTCVITHYCTVTIVIMFMCTSNLTLVLCL